jgi:hypothetical protein
MAHPLIEEAAKKAAVAWIDGRLAWCTWVDGALYTVSGPGEQDLSHVEGAARTDVTMRGDHGGRVLTWPAEVARVEPGGDEWQRVAPVLAGKRLNASGGPQELAARWAAECTVLALRPAGEPAEAGDTLPAGSLAEPPRPTPAARPARRPFRLHRVRRQRG